MSYYLVGNSSALSGDIITSENWSQYISAGGGDWNITTDVSYSDLYNAKELMIIFDENAGAKSFFHGYFPDGLGNNTSDYFLTPTSYGVSSGYLQYNGSSIEVYNTSSSADSNLYNAKEMVLYWQDNGSTKHQSYLNFTANFNFETGQTLGTGWTNQEICLDSDDTRGHPSITYNGSSIITSNCIIFYILYKT